jgi:drug/metabolite transporter (DMT)-like permease
MGRFEKRPDNPRVRGELSRAAETALWAVVEDLENLQQNFLRSLQEEIKRLQADKTRLSDEIQQLLEEKEHLQQVRQITEQQVLIRQLSEALAKHISSQLQSSLTTLVNKSLETNSQPASALNSGGDQNQNAEKILETLDDTLTITFNSLQQELKNYQSNLSQQLSRMQSQQQQGEAIFQEFIHHLRGELEKTTTEISQATAKASPPTVLQPSETPPPSSPQTHLQLEVANHNPTQPTSTKNTENLSHSSTDAVTVPLSSEKILPKVSEPSSVSSNSGSASETKSPPEPPTTSAPSSVSSNSGSASATKFLPEPPTTSAPISVSSNSGSASATKFLPEPPTTSAPSSFSSNSGSASATKFLPEPPTTSEPMSVISNSGSASETKSPPQSPKASEPISVINKDSFARQNKPLTSGPATQLEPKFPSSQSTKSQKFSPVQIGFLMVVLSTVISSLYNITIKGMFSSPAETFAQGIISPTLGNILLIFMLRLMVVVPLMLLLAPMMYPQIWEDIQNLIPPLRGNSRPNHTLNKQKTLQLTIASGCFLFVSQLLSYVSIGQVETGIAIALFFIYPLITPLLSWLLFRQRLSGFKSAAGAAIFCGQLLVLGGSASLGMAHFFMGSITGILAGVAFACFVILTGICGRQIHPVSLSLINFTTMLILSFICLMLPLPSHLSLAIQQSKLLELILSAFILGVLTLLSYVLNHLGSKKLGASRAAMIGAGVPILTVVFADLILQEKLGMVQILGVLFVSFGLAAFSFENMLKQVKPSNSQN